MALFISCSSPLSYWALLTFVQIFFLYLFLLLRHNNCQCPIFLLFFLPAQIYLWTSLINFYFNYYTFQFQNFFIIFLGFFSSDISIVFTHHFLDFLYISFSSLSNFKTVDLKCFSRRSFFRCLLGAVSVNLFVSWMGHTFLFLCASCIFHYCYWKLHIWTW